MTATHLTAPTRFIEVDGDRELRIIRQQFRPCERLEAQLVAGV